MSVLSDPLLDFTSVAFVFLIGEALEWLILKRDEAGWHFRFGEAEGYSNLNPVISTVKVAAILFVLILVVSPFVLPQVFNSYVLAWIATTKDWYLISLLSITFSFLWIWHHVAGKDWNWQQDVLALISVVLLLAYIGANIVT
jgi:hypothetical protein